MRRFIILIVLLIGCNDFGDETRTVEYYASSTEPIIELSYLNDDGESVEILNAPSPSIIELSIDPGEHHLMVTVKTDPMGPDSNFETGISIDGRTICHTVDYGIKGITELTTNDESGFFTCHQ